MFRKLLLVFLCLTFIVVPYSTASAIPSGVGVLGDSATQPYQCIGRGDATTFTWTEVLNRARGVNFGGEPCEPYNKAWSGHTIRVNMTSQTNKIIADFNNGYISKVISMMGRNDVYGSVNPPDVPALMDVYDANIQAMIDAGISPSDILIVDINQEAEDSHPSTVYINQLNAGLLDIALAKGTAFASFDSFNAELECREIGNTKTYNVGGQTITSGWGNEYHNLRVADGHLGTVGNGLLANSMIIDFLGLPRMTDAEILAVAGGVENPSNPPPTCGGATSTPPPPTATGATSTPTATRTATPTRTATATSSSGTITLGETTVLSTSYSGNRNRLVAQQVTLTQSATIESLSYYVSTASGQLRLGIYNNNGSNPGALMAETAAFTPVSGWNTQNVITPALLSPGTYWLAFLPESNSLAGRVIGSGTGRYYSYTFGVLPASYSSSPTNAAFRFSFYATLSTGAVASNTPTNTPLPTNTSTFTPSATVTNTLPANTATFTPSATFTNTLPANTATFTPSATITNTSPANTVTVTPTRTSTLTSTVTFTPTQATLIPTSTSTATPTRTPTTPPSTITLGETSVLSTSYSGNGNRLLAQQVTLSQSATIQSLSYYVATTGGQLRLGIYNNNGNQPGALVAETAAFTPAIGWNTQPVLTQTLLPAGNYWLAFLPQSNSLAGKVVGSGAGRYYSYTFGSLPANFSSSPSSTAFRFSFYATLSIAAVPTNTPTNTLTPTRTPTNTLTFTPTNTATATQTPPSSLFIQIVQPNGGEVLTPNTTYRIMWDSTSDIDTVSIGYKSCDSCLDWIVNNIPNSGFYDWSVYVGNTANTQFKIYIIGYDTGVGSVNDVSDNNFTVLQPTPTPTNTSTFTPTRTPTASSSTITIGETNVLSTSYSGNGNRLLAQQVTLSQSATIESLSYYVATTGGQLRLGIYNNNGNKPGALMAQTVAFTPVAGWNTQSVITPTLLPPGTYWLAFLPQNNALAGRVVGSGTGRYYSYSFAALPANFSASPSSAAFRFSFYATLSVP